MKLIASLLASLILGLSSQSAAETGNAEAGKKLWETPEQARCADCHGRKGEGGFGPVLAGRATTLDEFKSAVRTPRRIMPAYASESFSDQQLTDFYTYLQGLPPVTQRGPWKVQAPAAAPRPQQLLIATYGCGQCHGATLQGPRTEAGAINADYEWFKGMVYNHTPTIREHRKLRESTDPYLRMGNYTTTQVPESDLADIWRYMKDELKFRSAVAGRMTPLPSEGAYTVNVTNRGMRGRGLVTEGITVVLALKPGTKVVEVSGPGYKGVTPDAALKAETIVWELPRLQPADTQTFTVTVANGGVEGAEVRWASPVSGAGAPENKRDIEIVKAETPKH